MGPYFFCGIGGSGMLPLALILTEQSVKITGSDRSYDQGRTPKKFEWLKSQGIEIVPQDGKSLTTDYEALIISSAIEDSIPEVAKAKDLGIPIIKRAELLASLFNKARISIAIGGTSGKSTTTGMLTWIMFEAQKDPTVMNGANFLNFVSPARPYASSLVGDPDLFVSECDESDGSIILYHPTIAVLNNIALDHKPIEDLVPIFRTFLFQSQKQVLNLQNETISEQLADEFSATAITTGINHPSADLNVTNYAPTATGSSSTIEDRRGKQSYTLILKVPGKHNIENALSALGAAIQAGIELEQAVKALETFSGVKRRLENIGNYNNINVIDDFAHNPDKVKASLSTCNEHFGRLLIMFQMHGYGPFKLMKDDLICAFVDGMKSGDILYMPDVLYLGGATDKSYTSRDFINEINERGGIKNIKGEWLETREGILAKLVNEARAGDRIIIMGARDDTLSTFAQDVLTSLQNHARNSQS
jgi:UDP-N-acetylmuramate--alanine ligase